MSHLTDDAKDLVDRQQYKVLSRESETLTRTASEVANSILGEAERDWLRSFERLHPGDLDPQQRSDMIMFLLLRLRLAMVTGKDSLADQSALAAMKFGATSAAIDDAISDLGSPRMLFRQAGSDSHSAVIRLLPRQKTSTPIPASHTREG